MLPCQATTSIAPLGSRQWGACEAQRTLSGFAAVVPVHLQQLALRSYPSIRLQDLSSSPTADLAQTPTSPSASILRSRPTDAASSFAPRRSPCSSGLVATSNRHHGRPFCAGVQVPYVLAQTSRPRRIRSDTLTLLSRPRLRQVYQEGVLLRQYPYQPQCVGYKLGQGACRPAGSVHGHLKRLAR